MIGEIHRLRDKSGETEKITINIGFVDLGHIDLLVHEGFYSNRFRLHQDGDSQPAPHSLGCRQASIVRHTLELGLRHYTRDDLEAVKAAGGKLRIQLAIIAEDVTPELALATIESITVLGVLQARKAVKAALSDRIG